MKTYQVNGNSHLTEVQTESSGGSDLIKIKVTHLMLSESDINLFSGRYNVPSPLTPGKIAIGVVSDDRPEFELRRGMKVILNPYQERGGEKKPQDEVIGTRGIDSNGFFSDYVMMNRDKIILFPEDVEENDALFTVHIACALKILSGFQGEKGDHIAIVGSDPVCCILAQLALYFQYIPIVIDNNAKGLSFAKKKGVYYTIDSTKDVPYDRVKEITGGRMVDMSVINLDSQSNCAFLFPITGENGTCVIFCDGKTNAGVDADISQIGKKNLVVRGISEGNSEMGAAVNILVQNILDLKGFIDKKISPKDAEMYMRELADNPERYYSLVVTL